MAWPGEDFPIPPKMGLVGAPGRSSGYRTGTRDGCFARRPFVARLVARGTVCASRNNEEPSTPSDLGGKMIGPVPQTVGLARRIAEGMARRLNTLERTVSPEVERTRHNQAVVRAMNDYDMVTQPDEPYYARQ